MFSKLHQRFGTAGLIVSVIALVAAIAGTAIPAGGLTAQQEKQVKKIAKKFAGKRGPIGPAGPTGPPGQNGTSGKDGAPGAAGAKGATGAAGPIGATGATGPIGVTGATGATGPAGPACPQGNCTLPSGATETGTYSYNMDAGTAVSNVSFSLPLSTELGLGKFKIVAGAAPEECDNGTGDAPSVNNPEADPGWLCIFPGEEMGDANIVVVLKPNGAGETTGKSGALLVLEATEASTGGGSFAVTAP